MRVMDLIIPGTCEWDVELIEELFNEADMKEILSIPLALTPGRDIKIWHYSKNGWYTVKFAYRLACSLTIENELNMEGRWKSIWGLDVPSKVKVFLWRAAHNVLPTKANLLNRGVTVGGECGICLGDHETEWHSLLACPFARCCWRFVGLEPLIQHHADTSESFSEFLFAMLNNSNESVRVKVGMVMWKIWKDKNAAIWKKFYPLPARSCDLALSYRKEWLAAQKRTRQQEGKSRSQGVCKGWHDLDDGWIHCGVDAAFSDDKNSTYIGIVLQNFKVEFIAAEGLVLPEKYRVSEGEAMGIHEALSWVKQRGHYRVQVVSDCKVACDAVWSYEMDNTELGAIAMSCRLILA